MSEPEVTITKSRLREALAGGSADGLDAIWSRLAEHFEPGKLYQAADGKQFMRLWGNGDHPWLELSSTSRQSHRENFPARPLTLLVPLPAEDDVETAVGAAIDYGEGEVTRRVLALLRGKSA